MIYVAALVFASLLVAAGIIFVHSAHGSVEDRMRRDLQTLT